jgi:hypothetical protein
MPLIDPAIDYIDGWVDQPHPICAMAMTAPTLPSVAVHIHFRVATTSGPVWVNGEAACGAA